MISPKYPTIDDLNQEDFINELNVRFGKDVIDEIQKNNTHRRIKTMIDYGKESIEKTLREGIDKQTIGRLMSTGSEQFQRDFLNLNTRVKLLERTGGVSTNNNTGYDHISTGGLECQGKFRSGTIHFSTTRRASGKNSETIKDTGQVPYGVYEFGTITVQVPINRDDVDWIEAPRWTVVVIPAIALMNLASPRVCIQDIKPTGVRPFKKNVSRNILTVKQLFEPGAASMYGFDAYRNRYAEVLEYAEKNRVDIKKQIGDFIVKQEQHKNDMDELLGWK